MLSGGDIYKTDKTVHYAICLIKRSAVDSILNVKNLGCFITQSNTVKLFFNDCLNASCTRVTFLLFFSLLILFFFFFFFFLKKKIK